MVNYIVEIRMYTMIISYLCKNANIGRYQWAIEHEELRTFRTD